MDHRFVRENMCDYIDGLMRAEDARAFESHIASCPECNEEYRNQLLAKKILEDLPYLPVPDALHGRIMADVDTLLLAGGRQVDIKWYRKPWLKVGGLAAAVVLIVGVTYLSDGFGSAKTNDSYFGRTDGYVSEMDYTGKNLVAGTPPAVPSYDKSESYEPMMMAAAEGMQDSGLLQVERKISYNANLHMEVSEYKIAFESIRGIAARYNGYVSDSNTYDANTERPSGYVSIKVDSAFFDDAVAELAQFGDVKSQNIYSSDHTSEYYDMEGRLTQHRAEETRLLEVLNKAETVYDILLVEAELNRVRRTIESISGSLKYLESITSLSTISVSLTTVDHSVGTISPNRWDGLGKEISAAFVSMINWMINAAAVVLIFLGQAAPWLVLLGVLLLVRWIVVAARRSKKKSA